jgi:histidine ammonia-lyase
MPLMAGASSIIDIDGRQLTLESIRAVAVNGAEIRITADARRRVASARRLVEEKLAQGEAIYGVTTGFGRLANVPIARADAEQLQLNLVRSHAAGTGPALSESFVRAAGVLRVSSLAAGHSGIREETLDLLAALLNRGITPLVPSQGSVGASGDLAPLAHMTLTLVGEGDAYFGGEKMKSARALQLAGLTPIKLAPKEGLSLVNGTEAMTGVARAFTTARRIFDGSGRRHRRHVARSVPGYRSCVR